MSPATSCNYVRCGDCYRKYEKTTGERKHRLRVVVAKDYRVGRDFPIVELNVLLESWVAYTAVVHTAAIGTSVPFR